MFRDKILGITTKNPRFLEEFRHVAARRYYSGGYMGKKRRELVMRFGYDGKKAAHLIRLLRMGIESLTEGTM